MQISTASLKRKGRPWSSRTIRLGTATNCASSAAIQASGRRNHGRPARKTHSIIAATEKLISASSFQPAARCKRRKIQSQPGLWSILYSGRRMTIWLYSLSVITLAT